MAREAPQLLYREPELPRAQAQLPGHGKILKRGKIRIGVAQDEAFCFTYRDNLQLLQDLGAERNALHRGERDVFHPIEIAPGSLLERLFGPGCAVNSAHHQGVDRLGQELLLTAWAPDGTVEGLEHQGAPAVGVQFHPERLPGHPAAARALFQWLITQAAAVPLC